MYSNESISYEEMKRREEEYRKKNIPGYNPAPHNPAPRNPAPHNPLLLPIGWDLHQIPETHPTKNEKRVFHQISNKIVGNDPELAMQLEDNKVVMNDVKDFIILNPSRVIYTETDKDRCGAVITTREITKEVTPLSREQKKIMQTGLKEFSAEKKEEIENTNPQMKLHKENSVSTWDNLNRQEVGPRSVLYTMAPSTKQVYVFQSMIVDQNKMINIWIKFFKLLVRENALDLNTITAATLENEVFCYDIKSNKYKKKKKTTIDDVEEEEEEEGDNSGYSKY